MNVQSNTVVAGPVVPATPAMIALQSRAPALLFRTLVFPVKFLWGMIFCQGLLGSILVVGWTYRLAQRAALKFWWSQRPKSEQGLTLDQFLNANEWTRLQQHWPNWFLQQNFRKAISAPRRRDPALAEHTVMRRIAPIWNSAIRLPYLLGHSLWLNFWIGLRAITNTWLLTLPACLFWWFGWYDGWNNSFNKGYEQAPVGPLISIVGIVLFIVIMFYVPLAQARQAVTGEWRSFFQFRLIWRVVRLRWISSVGLALCYSLFGLPLNVLKTSPIFQPQMNAGLANLTDVQVVKHLDSYFFFCAMVVLPAYVLLRLVAARVYASGILALVHRGEMQPTELGRLECETLGRLGLLEGRPGQQRHFFVRFITWTGTRVGRIASTFALAFIWFSFVAQIYITEFLQYHRGLGWMNQPLVQLPWFHYIPARLKNPWNEISLVILVWLLASIVAWGAQALRSKRSQ